MLPDKKIIAFDMDGTLTESKSPIAASMAVLLKELIKQKLVFAVSGGKFEQFETQFLPPFEQDNAFLPFIHNLKLLTTCGTQRYDFDEIKNTWVLADKEPLSEEVKEKVKKLLQEIIDSGNYEIPPNSAGYSNNFFRAWTAGQTCGQKRLGSRSEKKKKNSINTRPEITRS
jgi:phosphoglycolate phosphatase-like HAD superfamily hydrolase